jgi:hypothetical protein
MDDEFIMCEADFFIEKDNDEIGHCISLIYLDRLPNLPEKKKYLLEFEEKGFNVVDYEVKFRPIRTPMVDHTDYTKH